jgi:hypothetical protein
VGRHDTSKRSICTACLQSSPLGRTLPSLRTGFVLRQCCRGMVACIEDLNLNTQVGERDTIKVDGYIRSKHRDSMYNGNNELVRYRSERDWHIRLLASPEVWYEQTRCNKLNSMRPEEARNRQQILDVRGSTSEHKRKMWLAHVTVIQAHHEPCSRLTHEPCSRLIMNRDRSLPCSLRRGIGCIIHVLPRV